MLPKLEVKKKTVLCAARVVLEKGCLRLGDIAAGVMACMSFAAQNFLISPKAEFFSLFLVTKLQLKFRSGAKAAGRIACQ